MKAIQKRIQVEAAPVLANSGGDIPEACDLIIPQNVLAEVVAVAALIKAGSYQICACGFKGYDSEGEEMTDMDWRSDGVDLIVRNYSHKDDGGLVLTAKVFNRDTDEEYLVSKQEIVLSKDEIDALLDTDEVGTYEVCAKTTITRESTVVTGKPSDFKTDSVLISRLIENKEVDCNTVLHFEKVKS